MTTLATSLKSTGLDIDCLDKLLRKAPVGVLICTAQGEICYANEFSHGVFGKEEKPSLIGVNLFEVERMKNAGLQGKFPGVIKESQIFQHELVESGNGADKKSNLNLKVIPLEHKDVGPNGFICFVEDFSEHVELQRNLKDKLRELSIINEVSLALSTTLMIDQILQVILIGVTCGEGLGFNRAFLLLLDDRQNQLVGKMGLGTSDPDEARGIWEELSKKKLTFKEALQSYTRTARQSDAEVERIIESLKIPMDRDDNILVYAVKNRTPLNSEQNFKHLSTSSLTKLLGTERFAVAPLVSKDEVRGVIIADNFITSKPITEEDIRLLQILGSQASVAIENSELYNELTCQVKKLEQANKALAQNTEKMIMIEKFSTIGQITSRVAHQLRNPMTIIGGFAKSLTKKSEPDDPRYHSLQTIAQEVERMERILDRLSDFTPKPEMRLMEDDLNQTIEQSLKMVEKKLIQSGVVLAKDLEKDLPSIPIDSEQLQVALINVFRNSIQAMPSGGELKVTTWTDGNRAKIKIADKGPGIPEKEIKHIFDPFYTTRENADGLGLTIASEIIKNHNGQTWAESQKGEGTSVFINLPMKRGEHQ